MTFTVSSDTMREIGTRLVRFKIQLRVPRIKAITGGYSCFMIWCLSNLYLRPFMVMARVIINNIIAMMSLTSFF